MKTEQSLTMKIIPIVRMDCPTCISLLENEVRKLKGVNEVRGNYIARTLKVVYDPDVVQLSQIETAIERAGYQIAYKKYPSAVSRLKGLLRREKPSKVQAISDADFLGKVLHASKPVAVLFSSSTCPACQALKPSYTEAAEDIGENARFFEMDISSSETWRNYDVLITPAILIFREGQVKARLVSLPRKEEIENALST
jgi:thiol-disulfide isomerase/thioredoxin